ncbi:MAG: HpcH/HpaI aldolase/citrate lyase family protein [Betaproteobacteria bacterium]|nr:HpcH/HpaI aldolase/citrate lyase family protein [Betaproteobacteria bacterium]
MPDPTQLGASLYVPATHHALAEIAAGIRLGSVRSLIVCTEDSVSAQHLPGAMDNLAGALRHVETRPDRLVFVRARNLQVLRAILEMPGADRLAGFVLPKITAENIDDYLKPLHGHPHRVMPTLETRETFVESEMYDFLRLIEHPSRRDRIFSMRIGGNDLLALLRMRRPKGRTIYETPLGHIIARLATIFIPQGFSLSAPVFEHMDDPKTLSLEIEQDLNHGLVGKTAIHPNQIPLIEQHYRVCERDLNAAVQILASDAPGVFRLDQSMCEPATHRPWAQAVLLAARHFGSVKRTN